MRGLILAAFSLLLLVSAASAIGDSNIVISEAFQSTTGTCVVGANLFQGTTLDTNLLGCGNEVEQNMFVTANDNSLLGTANLFGEGGEEGGILVGEEDEEGEFFMGMNFVQGGEMVFNGTGSYNVGYQDIDLNANDNCQTFGNFSQMAIQTADTIGCDNDVFQDTDANAIENSFLMSNVQQASLLNACVVGDDNDVDTHVEQDLFGNCVTTSSLSQQAVTNLDWWGCDNTGDLGADFEDQGQEVLQVIVDSDFLRSTGVQAVSQNSQILGSDNAVAQFGETLVDDSCFTMGTLGQAISETFIAAGCGTLADQDATLEVDDNSVVGGNIMQQTTIKTNTIG